MEARLSLAWYIVLERTIPGTESFVNGKAVATVGELLTSFAKQECVPTLMSFFSVAPTTLAALAENHGITLEKPRTEKWFTADEGLKTLKVLIDEAEKHRLDGRVIEDLRDFQTILGAAKKNSVRWHLAVDY